MKHLNSIDFSKLVRYLVGAVLAILIAELFKLEFSMSAGILTILTIQDTKKETIAITGKRIAIFLLMTALSVLLFPIAGYNLIGFSLLLIPYLFCCFLFSMKEAIAPIAVLCTHYVSAKSCSFPMILNESLLLLIGGGIGILLNLFMGNNLATIRYRQKKIDDSIRIILSRMSVYIMSTNKSGYTGSCFKELDKLLSSLKLESIHYMDNHFIGTNDYFYHYVQMRLSQCTLLKRMYQDILTLNIVPQQAAMLSELLRQISLEFNEINNGKHLLELTHQLQTTFKEEALPRTRREFENRAVLYHILMDITSFLTLKLEFANSLTTEEKDRYWPTN